jgi:CubicO group peptidase (beta-lactamase class C family)
MSIDVTSLQEMINEQDRQQPFSGVIMVREGGQTVFEQAYGHANKADAIPNTLETRFAMASGCKVFTAVAIGQLIERGLLTFDTRLKDCVSVEFPHFDPAVTVGQLLMHTSGIPDYFDEEIMDDFGALWKERPVYNILRPADFLPMFQNEPMKSKPGEKWAYNNAGFIVLGLIVEAVSGIEFPQYIEDNIFKVCDMQESGYFLMNQLPARTAYGYIPVNETEWRTNIYDVPIIGGADGGAFTTVGDMAKFWDSLLGYRLLSENMTRTFLTPQAVAEKEADGKETCYGYGVWLTRKNEDEAVATYYSHLTLQITSYHKINLPGDQTQAINFPTVQNQIIICYSEIPQKCYNVGGSWM